MSSSPNYTDQSAAPAMGGLEVVADHNFPEVVDGYMKPADAAYSGHNGYGGYAAATPAPSTPPVAVAEKSAAAAPDAKRTCGLRRSTLILLVLLAVVIVAAAVGGGVGGSMAVSQAYDRGYADAEAEAAVSTTSSDDSDADSDSDSDSNSNSTSGDTAVQNGRIELPPMRGKLPLDCPEIDGTVYTVKPQSKSYNFKSVCGADSGAGEGRKNIATIVAYHFTDCLRACASLNERGNVGDSNKCEAVHWHVDLAFTGSHGGNCWLKKGVDKLVTDTDADNAKLHVFATLDSEK